MNIDKAEVISVLRAKGLDAKADWVDRELPELVDTKAHRALLQMLGIDPATMASVDVAGP
ncbi:MAG: hypothetical protein QOI74_1164 [Micromonosporaceae bacterium]|jgi:hypothetical protein|nr:hypothetical protein [Micromonosporaceae bacterium]MDT5037801.1 hypothetical protein [Micromonosporaceae bacterium]